MNLLASEVIAKEVFSRLRVAGLNAIKQGI